MDRISYYSEAEALIAAIHPVKNVSFVCAPCPHFMKCDGTLEAHANTVYDLISFTQSLIGAQRGTRPSMLGTHAAV